MSRNVTITSVCTSPSYNGDSEADIQYFLDEVEKAAAQHPDVVLTPECWLGFPGKILDREHQLPEFQRLLQIAAKYKTYIATVGKREATEAECCSVQESHPEGMPQGIERICYNSFVLIDREGKVVYTYDKLYPWPLEFQEYNPDSDSFAEACQASYRNDPSWPGSHTGVVDCDFGRVGFAICFDLNFPEVWRKLAIENAELVLWSAAFDGGASLSYQAGCNNYYIVSSTCMGTGGCRVEDITGDELLYQLPAPGELTQTVTVTLDLDRTLFHKNYNAGQLALAEQKYPGVFRIDRRYEPTAEWLIVDSVSEEHSVKSICEEFDLVPYRSFKTDSVAAYIDKLRCCGIG